MGRWVHLLAALATAAVTALGLAPSAAAAAAASDQATYDMRVRGLKMGEMVLASEATPTRYAVTARIQSTGLAAALRHFSFRGQARGQIRGARLVPERYEEAANTGRRSSSARMTYAGGVPTLVDYSSPREAGPDSPAPSTQGGTLDPLSAIYAVLRAVPRDQACQLDVFLFDGKRRSRIRLRPAGNADGLPQCSGTYERLEGFTAEEVARHRRFDMQLSYEDAGGGLIRAKSVAFDSLYGKATLDRR